MPSDPKPSGGRNKCHLKSHCAMTLSSQGPWLRAGTDGHLWPQQAKVNMFKSSPLICHHLCKFWLLRLSQDKEKTDFPGDHSVK